MCRSSPGGMTGSSGRDCGTIFWTAGFSQRPRIVMSPPTPKRWKPTAVIQASVALHAAAIAGLLARPRWWPWMLGILAADHLLVTAAGLWPRSRLLGPNWTRLPAAAASSGAVAITIDDGPDPEITPRVLEVLEQFSARATFFCIGERVARFPQLARE